MAIPLIEFILRRKPFFECLESLSYSYGKGAPPIFVAQTALSISTSRNRRQPR